MAITGFVSFIVVQVLKKQYPAYLFNLVKFIATASVFPQGIVNIFKRRFVHLLLIFIFKYHYFIQYFAMGRLPILHLFLFSIPIRTDSVVHQLSFL